LTPGRPGLKTQGVDPELPEMSDSPEDAAPPPARPPLLRRLHALSGAIALGAFLVFHLGTVHTATAGRAAFTRTAMSLYGVPLRVWLGAVFIFVPLAFHAGYGLFLLATTRGAPLRNAPAAAWYAALHRLAGIATLVFLVVHLGQLHIPLARGTLLPTTLYPTLEALLGTPGIYAGYLAGLSATVFHFVYGLWRAAITWGFVVQPRAQRQSAIACAVFGLLLWGLGADTLVHFFARCGGVFGGGSPRVTAACRGADLSRVEPVAIPMGRGPA